MTIPKYVQTQRAVINLIASRNLEVGNLLPTEQELAERFGVSVITLRRAMGLLEERQIVRREQGRGTFVAAGMQAPRQTGTVAFLDIFRESLTMPTFGPSVVKLENSLERRGYQLRLLAAGRDPIHDVTKMLVDVDGVLVTGWITPEWLQLLHGLNMPVVIVGTVAGDTQGIPSVAYDWQQMAMLQAEDLFASGSANLGLIAGSANYAPSTEMRDGLAAACRRLGRDFDPDQVLFPDDLCKGDDIACFLDRRGSELDGLLVEAGCVVHVLGWLLNRPSRPRIGVLGVTAQFGQRFPDFVEAEFTDDIYEASIQTLFAMTERGEGHPPSVKLKPSLIAKACQESP